ncbi:MAG: hypothetical protein KatS3mg110_0781 [Pirellulaceae bacterium]|nr:MAG: hypothetical protein KatS3mg110_0781 [Pirellulaceae bacterium]
MSCRHAPLFGPRRWLVIWTATLAWLSTVPGLAQTNPLRSPSALPLGGALLGKDGSMSGTGERLPGYVPAHERRVRPATYQATENSRPAASKSTLTKPASAPPEIVLDEPMDGEYEADEPQRFSEYAPRYGDPCFWPAVAGCGGQWEFFGGTHGFTGPVNRGQTGSFGFHEGVNWGAPFPLLFGGQLGMQFGTRLAHSNLSGAAFTGEERQQIFVTGGLFRRVDWGFQGGLVVDYLHEDWYLEADLVQLRGEASWLYPCHHEVGVWFTANTQKDAVLSRVLLDNQLTSVNETLQATDLFAFFYRYRSDNCAGATGRVFAGFTGASDGLLGADVQIPINDAWWLQTAFTYLVPEESNSASGHIEEAWNFGLSLVWRPRAGFPGSQYYRPLFNVADNGSFLVDRR